MINKKYLKYGALATGGALVTSELAKRGILGNNIQDISINIPNEVKATIHGASQGWNVGQVNYDLRHLDNSNYLDRMAASFDGAKVGAKNAYDLMHNFSQIDSKYPISDTVNIIKGVYNKIPHIPFVKEDSEILKHIDSLIEENSKAEIAAIGIANLIKRYTIHSPGIISKLKEFIYSIFSHNHKEKMWTNIIEAKFNPLFDLFNKTAEEFKRDHTKAIKFFIENGHDEKVAVSNARISLIREEIAKIFKLNRKLDGDEIDKIYNSFVSYMNLHKLNGITKEDIINIFKNYFHPNVKTLTFLDSNLVNKSFDYILLPRLIATLFDSSIAYTSPNPGAIEPNILNNIDVPQNTIADMSDSDVIDYSSKMPFVIGTAAAAAGLGAYAVYNKIKQNRNKFTPQ